MDEMEEILHEFLVESHEGLDRLDAALGALERDAGAADAIAAVFRIVHTIKGTCGFFDLPILEAVAHSAENLLGRLRDGTAPVGPDTLAALRATADAVRDMLVEIEVGGTEGAGDHHALVSELGRLSVGTSQPTGADATGEPAPRLGDLLVSSGKATVAQVQGAIALQKHGDGRRLGEILIDEGVVDPADILEALSVQSTRGTGSLVDSSVRVDVALLDRLLGLVDKLGGIRDEVGKRADAVEGAPLADVFGRLDMLTAALRDSVVQTRMQPLGNVLSKFPRVARDLAVECGKRLRVDIEGSDTQLDKRILEAVKDPLTHLVRNAVDHGIQAPAARVAAGKPAEGRLVLRAFRQGSFACIEVTDDGAGIDARRVTACALERGMVTPAQAGWLGEREALHLIFVPGFSTAAQLSTVSGRGVGMDVVRTNVEGVGGTVTVDTEPGEGTTFRITIPLTPPVAPAAPGVASACSTTVRSVMRAGPAPTGSAGRARGSVPGRADL